MGELNGRRFEDRVVLIAGAGHGIGRQLALDFATEGALVGINDLEAARARDTADEVATTGGRSVALPADIRSAEQVDGRRYRWSRSRPDAQSATVDGSMELAMATQIVVPGPMVELSGAAVGAVTPGELVAGRAPTTARCGAAAL